MFVSQIGFTGSFSTNRSNHYNVIPKTNFNSLSSQSVEMHTMHVSVFARARHRNRGRVLGIWCPPSQAHRPISPRQLVHTVKSNSFTFNPLINSAKPATDISMRLTLLITGVLGNLVQQNSSSTKGSYFVTMWRYVGTFDTLWCFFKASIKFQSKRSLSSDHLSYAKCRFVTALSLTS